MKKRIIRELNLLEHEKTKSLTKLRKLKDNHRLYNSLDFRKKSIKINNRLTNLNRLIELNNIEYDNLQLKEVF